MNKNSEAVKLLAQALEKFEENHKINIFEIPGAVLNQKTKKLDFPKLALGLDLDDEIMQDALPKALAPPP